MPIFNFVCRSCFHSFEELVMHHADIVMCPDCFSNSCDKQFTGGSSFVLKGGGWEADGYATPKEKDDRKDPE